MSKTFTKDEVAKHNTEDSVWFVIDSKVYDVSDFIDAHPGGESVLRQVAGQDATVAFYNLHRHEVLTKYEDLCIGTIQGEKPQPVLQREPHRLRKAMRIFNDTYITPEAQAREADGKYISQELVDRMAEKGILHMRLGPGKHLQGVNLMDGAVKGEEFDYFHDLIMSQEGVRSNARGFQDGQLAGMVIGLPCIMNFMRDAPRRKAIMDEVLSGKKYMCLAITEAFAGSDVAGLRTTATKTPRQALHRQRHQEVDHQRCFLRLLLVGVKTDKGLSVLLIERGDGVETKPIKTSYSPAAGTAYITFDNVKVPAENLLGEENKGIYVILSNFNHERWTMACAGIRMCRTIVEECLKWSHQRIVFGKRLIEQPVIRQKLAKMIALIESNQAWLETITYQMCNMPYKQQSQHLGGPIGLLKMSITRAAHEIADESVQIFGGRGLTQSGMGRVVEMFHRTYKFDAILGGAEEVLADLGVRQAMRQMPNAKL
ncbi:Very long-chain specific acyl-CoA dehydrogenase, mitochondrial [Daldinia childiae]|uniref:Very long-chain specific acyl-CoA dehydrogenase, mitochondrial n=1 Tax=Daldinia childiae TaxID=326645 RepID=UPI001446CF3F|nr:Very long-chain specific acyl-CoA dehydrogenase, mitochondrial [Daldinia childiae]KAF3058460.1 Very long-chain specific acyl-CoA dehydrogenase, mitochondrial [Daldinia childiae]